MNLIAALVAIVIVMGAILTVCAYLIWLERKLSAWMQDRIGPNRVGPFGLLQPLADGLKFILKEEVVPGNVDRFLYIGAPAVSVFTALLVFAVVPFGPTGGDVEGLPEWLRFIVAPNVDIGIVFIFAISSLTVYGIIMGGWASNNKYSALGALRSSAQVISYEIPLGMSVLGVALMCGSLNLEEIMHQQTTGGFLGWNFWFQPLACLMFFISAMAESNRLPFDLSECEQELVGGFHTEYSGMKFAMFFLAEYTHVCTISFLVIILFFGGWHFPWIATPESSYAFVWVVKIGVLLTKVLAVIVLIMLLRWTIPRFRFDQLMGLAWKVMIPLSMVNVVATMFVLQFELNRWWLFVISFALFVIAGMISLSPQRHRPVRGAMAMSTGNGRSH